MATQVSILKAQIDQIKRDVEAIETRIRDLEQAHPPGGMPFAKMLGIWKGADFTEEEIDAVKISAKTRGPEI